MLRGRAQRCVVSLALTVSQLKALKEIFISSLIIIRSNQRWWG